MKERKMKDSGIPWIGEIPEEWEIHKLRGIAKDFKKGNGITKEDLDTEGDILCVRYGDLYTKYNQHIYDIYCRTSISKIQSPVFAQYGDILFTCSGEEVSQIGKSVAFMSKEDCLIGGDLIIMKHEQNPHFLGYSLDSEMAQQQKSCGRSKLKVVHISVKDLKNISVPIPTISEQEKIAAWLDKKCSEIDELIDVEQKMIDELEDYRKATITECVTQGLNPDVLMSKSNLPGVSVIPEHWKVCKLKNVCLDYQDGTHATFLTTSQGEYLLSAKNVHNDGIRISDNERTISSSDYKSIISNGFPKRGDILLCCVGTIGRCCIYNLDKPYAFQRSVTFLRINDNAVNTFIYYLLQSSLLSHQYQLYANASAQSGLYLNQVGNLSIVLPPLPEQQAIADYLDTKCKEIDDLIEVKRQKIETLKQYRQSIIFEAVTGKLNLN